jgi:RNA polymerase sigma-70 factor (ECF subfamily)
MESNTDIFWTLLEKEHTRARTYCHRLTADPSRGDDLYQDAILKAVNGFGGLKDHGAFRYWLYRIINNTFKDWLRTRRKNVAVSLNKELQESIPGENPLAKQAAFRRLKIAMAGLSHKDRALVTLHELEGWPLDEISQISGKSTGSLKTRLSRARAKMRQALIRYYANQRIYAGSERRIPDAVPYDS